MPAKSGKGGDEGLMLDSENEPRKQTQCVEEGDFPGCLGRIILDVGYVFTYLWTVLALIGLAISGWAAFIADPSVTSPGSLNRDSPTGEKVAHIGFAALLVVLGVAWVLLVRHLRRRTKPR
jgi:hypothetical protein